MNEPDPLRHPTSDAEIIELVEEARTKGYTLRVVGDGHSVAHAIYADPLDTLDNKVKQPPPPRGDNINVTLDRYGRDGVPGYEVLSSNDGVIEVDGGMRLGRTPGASDPRGLLQRLYEDLGWMLLSTGGIAHQTVAGFIATASAGGTRMSSVSELVCGVTLIDAHGKPVVIDTTDDDFPAVVPHLGLLGIVTKVRLQCCERFTVEGKQVTGTPKSQKIDLSGEGIGTPLADFLRASEYARIEWWPQRTCERVRVWTGNSKGPPAADFKKQRVPFRMFKKKSDQPLAALALTALGNRHDRTLRDRKLKEVVDHIKELHHAGQNTLLGGGEVDLLGSAVSDLRDMGPAGNWVASEVDAINGRGPRGIADLSREEFVEGWLPGFFKFLLNRLMPLGQPDDFHDYAWCVLPMDDEVDDVFLPVEFTEIWVPLTKARDAINALHRFFAEPESETGAFERTGTFEIELYATTRNRFWLNPAYSDGEDMWSEGALRINPYWYGRNAEDPTAEFLPQFWDLLRTENIPYRLHWGKFLPPVAQHPWWPGEIQERYPQWEEFMKVRARHDPDGLFVNDYWCKHLGLPYGR